LSYLPLAEEFRNSIANFLNSIEGCRHSPFRAPKEQAEEEPPMKDLRFDAHILHHLALNFNSGMDGWSYFARHNPAVARASIGLSTTFLLMYDKPRKEGLWPDFPWMEDLRSKLEELIDALRHDSNRIKIRSQLEVIRDKIQSFIRVDRLKVLVSDAEARYCELLIERGIEFLSHRGNGFLSLSEASKDPSGYLVTHPKRILDGLKKELADRHGFWGSGRMYPTRDAEISKSASGGTPVPPARPTTQPRHSAHSSKATTPGGKPTACGRTTCSPWPSCSARHTLGSGCRKERTRRGFGRGMA
jgi:hypothetical protein